VKIAARPDPAQPATAIDLPGGAILTGVSVDGVDATVTAAKAAVVTPIGSAALIGGSAQVVSRELRLRPNTPATEQTITATPFQPAVPVGSTTSGGQWVVPYVTALSALQIQMPGETDIPIPAVRVLIRRTAAGSTTVTFGSGIVVRDGSGATVTSFVINQNQFLELQFRPTGQAYLLWTCTGAVFL
jgi:hypothetical protein